MAIDARHVSKSFANYVALRDVDLHVEQSELVALLGPRAPAKPRCCASSPDSTRPIRIPPRRWFVDGQDILDGAGANGASDSSSSTTRCSAT
jgi:hypothetical protein